MEIPQRIEIIEAIDRKLEAIEDEVLAGKYKNLANSIRSNPVILNNTMLDKLPSVCQGGGFTLDEMFDMLYDVDCALPKLAEYMATNKKYEYMIELVQRRIADNLPSKSSCIAEKYLEKEGKLKGFFKYAIKKFNIYEFTADMAKSAGMESNEVIYKKFLSANNEYHIPILGGYAEAGRMDYFVATMKVYNNIGKIFPKLIGLIPPNKIAEFIDWSLRLMDDIEDESVLSWFSKILINNKNNLPNNICAHFVVNIFHRSIYLKAEHKIDEKSYNNLLKIFSGEIGQIINYNGELSYMFTSPEKFIEKMGNKYPRNHNFSNEIESIFINNSIGLDSMKG